MELHKQQQHCNEMMNTKVVMTDEQVETLQKQIAAYVTITEQLNQMYQDFSSSNQHLAGARLRGLYCDPLLLSGGQRISSSSRQRWTPTPVQLQILEKLFETEIGCPRKDQIKEITADLSKYGQISESNVYNWFQNRRARSKRKQHSAAPRWVNVKSEVETKVDSKDKTTKTDKFVASQPAKILTLEKSQVSSGLQYINPKSDDAGQSSKNFDHVPASNGMLSNTGISNCLTSKTEARESYNIYNLAGDYNTNS